MESQKVKVKTADARNVNSEKKINQNGRVRMIKDLLKYIPLVCFTAIIITEILCGFDRQMIGYAVFGLFVLLMFGAVQ